MPSPQKVETRLVVLRKVRFPVFVRVRDKRDVDGKVLAAYKTWKVENA